MKLQAPTVSILGPDPTRTHRINANSFQQNAITTASGRQYAAFYTDVVQGKKGGCYVNLARRRAKGDEALPWEVLTFEDYVQTMDDGHNTISIGICRGDGTIHVAFDHHCDQLRFRISQPGVAGEAAEHAWEPSNFSQTQNYLPGVPTSNVMTEVTYPRFLNVDKDLFLAYRIGQAGSGSEVLFRYAPMPESRVYKYSYLGRYLTGISNSPYINGIDYRRQRIHISWCYRNFVPFVASADAHKQQAGPNGPENNFDLNYAYSDDRGSVWKSSAGECMADLSSKRSMDSNIKDSIMPDTEGARVFEIPMNSGILNQEAQVADWDGGFWVLNREKVEGQPRWIVYHRNPKGAWTKKMIDSPSKPTETGSRGSICADRNGSIFLVLPGNTDSSLSIMRARQERGPGEEILHEDFKYIWRSDGFDGEPLIDVQRLEVADVLSVFTRTLGDAEGLKNAVVLNFDTATL